MLTFRVSQSFSQICHRIVQCQASYRQFRLFRLLLLVLGCTFLGSPFILLLLIHFVHFLHFRSPCVNHGVNTSLARCKITGDVGDEVQRVHLAVNGNLHARCEHSDGRTDGCDYRQCQCRTHCADGIPNALRQLRQRIIIEQIVLGVSLVQRIYQRLIVSRRTTTCISLLHSFLTDGREHILQSLRHLRDFLVQCRIDASHLFLFGKPIVAGNNLSQQIAVKTTDVAQVHSQLEGQRIAVGAHRLLPIIIQLPPLLNDFPIRNPEIIVLSSRSS